MPLNPTALSASAAQTVVAAASMDAWGAAKPGLVRLLGRGDEERELLVGQQLDHLRGQLRAAAVQELERELLVGQQLDHLRDHLRDQLRATAVQELEQARTSLVAVWRTRLADLLEKHPDVAHELQEWVDQTRAAQIRAEKACKRKQWRDALQPIPTILGWYKANAVAGTLIAAGFVVLKGYVIARGDLATALGILQYAGLATVVTAGLLSSLPILTAAMLAYTVIHTIESLGARARRRQSAVVMLGAFVLAAVFTSWAYLLIAITIGLVIALMHSLSVRKWVAWLVYALVASIAAVAVILSLYTVWLPHETVHFRPGTLPAQTLSYGKQVGYVLSEDNGWITMLTSGPHQIVRYPDADVMTQMVCERHPRPSDILSEVREGATLWDEITSDAPFLHPAFNTNCPVLGALADFRQSRM
jgi:hypothetical protein